MTERDPTCRGSGARGRIVIEKPSSNEFRADGYRWRAERARELIGEMRGTSREANAHLDDAPKWE
ncbi:hypothetical protein [Halostagnicola sp. A-GB9-2]|uniref:hypothetical protein n=1 Tax=Halostagnicola sp. A-GB9-2 TaxID=3048066 RepID=UPI0024BF9B22|nr:hypothetical protein [Halostagnicola sp. A-GB9-2]MDJ1432928.1 hypothetical protein [Halostagnicola sp. A-GB9-2]